MLIILVLLIYTSAAGETKDNENLFLQETIFTGYRYFPYITIKDLNLSLDRYHQIDKSKMNKSQQDSIQIGIITPGDLLFDIAVLYKTNNEIVLYVNNGNGTLSPCRILNGLNKAGSAAEKILLIPPEDIIGNPSRRCNLQITYGDGSEKTVSDIEIQKGKSEIIEKVSTAGNMPDMMTLPRGSLTDISFIEQWRSQNNGNCPGNVVVGDIDKDGRNEAVYTFWPLDQSAFPTRMVVFECVNQNTYRIDWDTTLQHGGYCLNSRLLDFDNDGNLEFFGIGWGSMTQNWEIGLWECTGEGKYRFRRVSGIYSYPQTIDVKDSVTLNGITKKGFFICYSNPEEPYYTLIMKYRFTNKNTNNFAFDMTPGNPSVPCFVYSMQAGKFDEDGRDMFALGLSQWSSYYICYLDSTGVSTNAGYEWKDMNFNEPVSGGFLLGRDMEADGTPEIIAAGIGVGTGTLGVVKHAGSPGANQWQTMWWDSAGVRGMPNTPLDTITWDNKFSFLHSKGFMEGGPYHPHFLTKFTTYTLQNIFSFYQSSSTIIDSMDIGASKLIDMDKDGKMNIIASKSAGLVQADTFWNCLSDFEATGTIGVNIISTSIPASFTLYQNYPNPFNSETVIKFDMPESGNVVLKIYDISGREIAALINENKPAGNYRINFNADKYKMSSGIYFYVLKTNKSTQTKKLVYIK